MNANPVSAVSDFVFHHTVLFAALWAVTFFALLAFFFLGRQRSLPVVFGTLLAVAALPPVIGALSYTGLRHDVEHRYGVSIDGHLSKHFGPVSVDGHKQLCRLTTPRPGARLLCKPLPHTDPGTEPTRKP